MAKSQLGVSVLICLFFASTQAGAHSGSVSGRVVDEGGNPLAGVGIKATSPDGGVPLSGETKRNGTFTLAIPELDWAWELTFTKEGFRSARVPLPEDLARTDRIELVMEVEPEARAEDEATPREIAMALYNQGVDAVDAGDQEAAAELFRESCAADPTYELPFRALATLAVKAEDWAAAGPAAEALLAFQPDDVAVMGTAYTAAVKTFDLERLEPTARRLAVADPSVLDNMVEVANWMFDADKLAEARALFVVITELSPERVDPHYKLGLVANGLGDTDLARISFQRFLAIAPDNHPDRQTAQELLDYLKN